MGKAFYNLEEIRSIPIKDVCESFGILLQKQGRNYFCKLRPENTASCILNINTRYGYDTFKDFGSQKYGDVIAFVQEYTGYDWQRSVEELASRFNIQPQNNTDYLKSNDLTDLEYKKIGIYGDLATKNLNFDLENRSLQEAENYSKKYSMTVNELRKVHPNKYLYEVIMDRALPHIHQMRHNYYLKLYNCLTLQKELLGHFDINNVPQEELDELTKECKKLIQAEGLLQKALRGTGYVYPHRDYDVRLDLQKIYLGEIAIEIGAIPYAKLQEEVSKQGVSQTYKFNVALFDYLSIKEYGIDDVPHAAFLKNDKVNLAFMPEERERIEKCFALYEHAKTLEAAERSAMEKNDLAAGEVVR